MGNKLRAVFENVDYAKMHGSYIDWKTWKMIFQSVILNTQGILPKILEKLGNLGQ